MPGGFGWHNPWPLEWGGGPTEDEKTYEAMRSAVGNLAAVDDTGIDGLWRQCRAGAYASASTFVERAVLQAFPQVATDSLPLWEDFLRIIPTSDQTDEDRRQAVVTAYTSRSLADGADVAARLKAIDGRISVLSIPFSQATTVMMGGSFEAAAPNYSSEFLIPVQIAITGSPTQADRESMTTGAKYLDETLPAWVDYYVVTGVGFTLDLSLLDTTALTDSTW